MVVEQSHLWRGPLRRLLRCLPVARLPGTTSGWWEPGRRATCLFVSGLTLNTSGIVTCLSQHRLGVTQWLQLMVIGLAIASAAWMIVAARLPADATQLSPGRRAVVSSRVLALLSATLLGLVVGNYVVIDVIDLPHHDLQLLDWLALASACAAIVIHLWDPAARFPWRGLYLVGLLLVGMLLVLRDLSPGKLFVWTGMCEMIGFMLLAALSGWGWQRFPGVVAGLKIPGRSAGWPVAWFCWSQTTLAAVAVLLIGWILLDSSFDGMGEGKALLGLSGHLASCPAALMLIGTAIVMAWQTHGNWRGGWQYAAMFAGMIFTSSIGWARIDSSSAAAWPRRIEYLLVSAVMMTLLTRFGLARVLPGSGDWIARARRAAPVFGSAALLLAIVSLIQWVSS